MSDQKTENPIRPELIGKSNRFVPAPITHEPIFERQPGESEQAFEAFTGYRDMGLGRSLSRLGGDLVKSNALLSAWSARWSWVKRCEAYDRWLDRQHLARQAQEHAKMGERQARQFQAMQSVFAAPVKVLMEKLQADPDAFKGKTVVELLESVARIAGPMKTVVDGERTARGAPTEIVSHGPHGSQSVPFSIGDVRRAYQEARQDSALGEACGSCGSRENGALVEVPHPATGEPVNVCPACAGEFPKSTVPAAPAA